MPGSDELLASLATPEVSTDPYPVYAQLRSLGPVRSDASGAVFLTSYADCAEVTRGQEYRSQSPQWCDRVTPGWREHPAKIATFETMLLSDPPDHTRLRRLASAAFTPRQADRMRVDIAALTGAALDKLADAGCDGSVVDIQEIIAASLPIAVIGSLVGVPEADWQSLRPSMSALLLLVEFNLTRQALAEADAAATRLNAYFTDLAAERRRAPRSDLASALVAAADASTGPAGQFTGDELVQTLTFVFMAGVDTMANLLANGMAALLAHPEQADLLRGSERYVTGAVDEVLRYDAPVQLVGRVAATDTVIGGTPVRTDDLVVAILGAGNRDPARFADPDTFDITRTGSAPLSFGGGIHRCLGAPLARVEAGTFFAAALSRFPGLRQAGQAQRRGTVFRGFSYLPVTVR